MKRIALFTALALGASVAAYASPPERTAQRDERTVVRDRDSGIQANWTRDHYDRYDRSHWAHDFRGRWVALSRSYNARSGEHVIPVRAGRFGKLRVEANRGEPVITRIGIEFGDGTTQAVDLNMRLVPGGGEVIDLNGRERNIRKIIVYADPHSRGSYTLYGA